MNYHGNLIAAGKSPSVYLVMSDCDLWWSRKCLSSANAMKFSMYLCVATSTNFLTAMRLYVFKHFIAIYSFIYRSKCQNVPFENIPKVGAIHKDKDEFNGIWRNWSLRNLSLLSPLLTSSTSYTFTNLSQSLTTLKRWKE